MTEETPEEISCSNCDNRTIPSSIMGKVGNRLSKKQVEWIAEVREMRCAECVKNLPFQPRTYTLEQAVEMGEAVAAIVAADAIERHRNQWVNTLKAQLKDGKLFVKKGEK